MRPPIITWSKFHKSCDEDHERLLKAVEKASKQVTLSLRFFVVFLVKQKPQRGHEINLRGHEMINRMGKQKQSKLLDNFYLFWPLKSLQIVAKVGKPSDKGTRAAVALIQGVTCPKSWEQLTYSDVLQLSADKRVGIVWKSDISVYSLFSKYS